MSAAGTVKAINKRVVHQICSGQVVLNLATAVKELIENSLDAGASLIEIKLREYGSEQVEVVDNASGIEESNFEALTLKHHTSKLQDFSDLSSVDTFGFRGEALSSLCALSDLVITTCHKSASVGTKIEYDHNGRISKKCPCPRQQGTTVLLQNLFYTLPVRHKEFLRNVKKEFAKMVQLLQAYCIISSGVKITCTNQVGKGKRTPVIMTHGNTSTKENIINIFGPKQLQNVLELEQVSPESDVCEEYGLKPEQTNHSLFRITGFISKPDHKEGRSTTDRQFYFINRRPCDFPKVSKLVNEVYHMYNRHQFPFVVMDISLAKDAVDVNLTPDKRKILVQEEKTLLAVIKTSLQKMFGPRASMYDVNHQTTSASPGNLTTLFGRGTTRASEESPSTQGTGVKLTLAGLKRSFSAASCNLDSDTSREAKQPRLDTFFLKRSKSVPQKIDSVLSSPSLSSISSPSTTLSQSSSIRHDSNRQTLSSQDSRLEEESPADSVYSSGSGSSQTSLLFTLEKASSTPPKSNNSSPTNEKVSSTQPKCKNSSPTKVSRTQDVVEDNISISQTITKSTSVEEKEEPTGEIVGALDQEVCASGSRDSPKSDVELEVTPSPVTKLVESTENAAQEPQRQEAVEEASKRKVKKVPVYRTDCAQEVSFDKKQVMVPFSMAGVMNRQRQCEKESSGSSRENIDQVFRAKIKPSDNAAAEEELKKVFRKESFTKMEIIGQFNLGFIIAKLKSDLFIIDQHATDEKHNFEDLQRNTVMQSQRLIQPMKLELTAVNEMILRDNLDIFRKNGFEFSFDDEASPTERVKLTSVPVSKNWTFGKEDIDEMIFMLSDAPGTMCRPSRIRQMFASRACRKSVMIGTALNKSEMTKLVNHMSDLDQPWNCPHGRPTFRHLFNLNMLPD